MAKFFGEIGYGESLETFPGSGVFVDAIVEYPYYGDVTQNSRRLQDSEGLNDDITVNNSISVVADEYAVEHFAYIRYIRWAGTLWTVTTVSVKSPRLILTLGSVYNGPKA